MSQQNSQTGQNHLALPNNHFHLNSDQLPSLELSQFLSNALTSPQLSLDNFPALNPQFFNQQSLQLAPLMSPLISKQLFPQLASVHPHPTQYQLPPSWLQIPMTPREFITSQLIL